MTPYIHPPSEAKKKIMAVQIKKKKKQVSDVQRPLIESPGNFSGPKSIIQIKIRRTKSASPRLQSSPFFLRKSAKLLEP